MMTGVALSHAVALLDKLEIAMLDLTKINKKNIESSAGTSGADTIAIITARDNIASGLATQIRMNTGMEVTQLNSYFCNMIDGKSIPPCDYIIIDLEDFNDISSIEQKIKFLFPITTKKIFVGDTDSIRFCNEMARIGTVYLHLESQMLMVGNALKKVNEISEASSYTQKISVIGCKGGSGTSLIAWKLFKSFSELSNFPILLIQGHTGTPDLDLIADTSLARDGVITHLNEYQGIKIATEEELWQFDAPDYRNYNIVIFDHNVTTQVRDKLTLIVPGSDFMFIVVTRELASVRNARLIIDEFERISPTPERAKELSKNIIILNENHLPKPDELSNEDIEDYLGKKIDIFHSYLKDMKQTNKNTSIHDFTMKMLGIKDKNKSSGKKKVLRFPFIFKK